jgi:hypothetical protein
MAFRRSLTLPVTCALTGNAIADHANLHIDHAVPFWLILRDFCLCYAINLGDLKPVGSGEHLTLREGDVVLQFQYFHEKHARLQATLKCANLEKSGDYED